MSDATDNSPIDRLKAQIAEVEGFIERDRLEQDELLREISLQNWRHELAQLQQQLAEAITWAAWSPAERIKWAENQILDINALIAKGVATPDTMLPAASNEHTDSPNHFEFAKAGWESDIDDLERVIENEAAKLR